MVEFWRKINNIFMKFPIGVLNLVTIISGTITIATPIVGAFLAIQAGKSIFTYLYPIMSIIFFAMLVIMFRYMVKYRKLYIGARKVTTDKFGLLSSHFRNSYFEILGYWKNGKLTVELLTKSVEGFLKDSLDGICELFEALTYQEISACIKYIDSVETDRESATIKTFVRSSSSDRSRIENDNNNIDPIYVKNNTDFYDILSPNTKNKKSYFYQRNLVKYSEELRRKGGSYNNTTQNWDRYYKSTIVVPISIANKRLFYADRDECYNTIGFLCIDSLSTDAFLEIDEKYNINIVKAYAALIYVVMSQYKHYLGKLTSDNSSTNNGETSENVIS